MSDAERAGDRSAELEFRAEMRQRLLVALAEAVLAGGALAQARKTVEVIMVVELKDGIPSRFCFIEARRARVFARLGDHEREVYRWMVSAVGERRVLDESGALDGVLWDPPSPLWVLPLEEELKAEDNQR